MKKDVPQLLTSFKEGAPSPIEHTLNHHQLLPEIHRLLSLHFFELHMMYTLPSDGAL